VYDGRRYLVEQAGTLVTFEGRAVGPLLDRLMPLLDGTRTVDDLSVELGPSVAPAVDRALSLLETHGLLVEGPAPRTASETVTAADFAVTVNRRANRTAAGQALEEARVAVAGSGSGADATAHHLEAIGIGRVEALAIDAEPPSDAFVVAVPGHAQVPELARLNEHALAAGVPWLQLLPFDGRVLVVGPLFLPGTSACQRCYRLRRGACSGYEEDFELIEREPLRAPAPAPLTAIGASLAVLLVLRWLTTWDATVPGRFYALEMGSVVGLSYERLLRVPRCPACGPPARSVPSPWFEASP
jgi:bacteriocin biosynthesis cyclodehydratase domain-containing protein